VLSRKIAAKNHFPAIDVLASVSRLFTEIASQEQQKLVAEMRNLMAVYAENEDLINIGAYERGASQEIDKAIELKPQIDNFLKQGIYDAIPYEHMLQQLRAIFK
jgi:flagellum-specific ATP synthase